MLGHIDQGEVILAKTAGEQQQGGPEQERDQDGQRFAQPSSRREASRNPSQGRVPCSRASPVASNSER